MFTVKPLLRDDCLERLPVLKDHTVKAEGSYRSFRPANRDHLPPEMTFLGPLGQPFKTGSAAVFRKGLSETGNASMQDVSIKGTRQYMCIGLLFAAWTCTDHLQRIFSEAHTTSNV